MKKLALLLIAAVLAVPAFAWWYTPCYYRPVVYTAPCYYSAPAYYYSTPTYYYPTTTYYYSAPVVYRYW